MQPGVGLVTHPVVSADGFDVGARLDNLHLTASVTLGVIAAKTAAGQDIVVGKSMALRRVDLERLGGFESVRDVLAEDFILGRRIRAELGSKVALLTEPVINVCRHADLEVFVQRFSRWSVMQRKTVGLPLYLLQAFLNPTPFAMVAALIAPTSQTFAVVALACAIRAAVDAASLRVLSGERPPLLTLALGPLRDLLVLGCWVRGLVWDRICWRGNELRVLKGSRLELAPARRMAVEG